MDDSKRIAQAERMATKVNPKKSEEKRVNTEPGENNKYLTHALRLANLPKVDPRDVDALGKRVEEYFLICAEDDSKPSVAGLALAIGTDRRRVWEWAQGSDFRSDILKKAYQILNLMMEDYMQNGKINPVSGIFLLKNNFGYQDKQEHIIKAGDSNGSMTEQELLQAADILPSGYLGDSVEE